MKRHRISLLLSLLLVSNLLLAAEAPTVLVKTAALKQQTMSDTVSGYGIVSPEPQHLKNINLPRPGQVLSLRVSAGQVVKKGAVLLEFGTSADAALIYQQARQAVDFAKGEVARMDELFSQQLATQSQVAAARKALADAEANLHAQQSVGAAHLREQISAPFDGIVMAVQVAQGDRLAMGASVLQLARSGGQRVLLGIEPGDAERVRPGLAASITPVLRDDIKLTGQVAEVFGMINPQTQLVDVSVKLSNAELMPGTQVHAAIELARETAWVVPRSAVLRDAAGTYLFQISGGKAHRINVRTGLEQAGLIAVQGDFDAKLPVVTLGNYELSEGMAVREAGQ